MTSYSNESYLYTSYNNENDALTCNSRPICSTLQNGKYISGRFHNTEYGKSSNNDELIGYMDMNACYQKMPFGNQTSNYMATLNDNSVYDTARINAIQELNAANFSADIQDPGGGIKVDYSADYDNLYNGRVSALDDRQPSKMLPQTPLRQSNSMLDGMYTISGTSGCGGSQSWQQGFRANQQATPPPAKSRMLPQPASLAGGVVTSDYATVKPHRPLRQLNGFGGPQGHLNATSVQRGSNNVRILPQPHAPLSKTCLDTQILKRHHFQDTINQSATISIPNYSNDQRTINQDQDLRFNNSDRSDIYSWAEKAASYSSSAFDIDNFCPLQNQQRPHTSLAPFNLYKDDDSEFGESGYFMDDNLSTYSDTPLAISAASPASLSAAAKQNLQQQRKLSLMMAMTTASVIASGETRITPNKKKKLAKSTSPIKKGTENRENIRAAEYGNHVISDVSVNSRTISTGSPSKKSNSSIYFNANSINSSSSNTTNRISQSLLATTTTPQQRNNEMIEPMPGIISTFSTTIPITTSTDVRPTRTRKLPKCLPMVPKSKKYINNDNITAITSVSNNKVLPMLPSVTKSNNNVCEKDHIQSCSLSPIKNVSLLASPTHVSIPVSIANSESISTSTLNQPSNTNAAELTNFSHYLVTPDLSNNNHSNSNLQYFDDYTSKAYSKTDDHINSSSTSTSKIIINSIFPSSTSQTTTSISSAPSMNSPTLASSIDCLDYLKSYTIPTAAKSTIAESATNETNIVTSSSLVSDNSTALTENVNMPFSLPSSISSTEKLKKSNAIDFIIAPKYLFTQNSNSTEVSVAETVPETMTENSTYINSFTTTIASSPSTPLKVSSSIKESLVPLETSASMTFTSNTFFDSLSRSSKFMDTLVAKTETTDDSSEETNKYKIITSPPITFEKSDILKSSEDCVLPCTTTSSSNLSGESFTESYAEYLKKFELPELPPLLTATDTIKMADTDCNSQIENYQKELTPTPVNKNIDIDLKGYLEVEAKQELPPYLTDTLKEDFSLKYDFPLDYKIDDFQGEPSVKPAFTTQLTSTASTEVSSSSATTISSTMLTRALPSSLVTSTTKNEINEGSDFYAQYLKNDNNDYASKYAWNVDDVTLDPATNTALSYDDGISDMKTAKDDNLLPVSSTISSAFDDSFYDSFKVDIDTLTAVITSDEQSSMTTTITTTTTSNNVSSNVPISNIKLEEIDNKSNYVPITSDGLGKSIQKKEQTLSESTQGGYYRPSTSKPLLSSAPAEANFKPPLTTTSAASKATSLIGGLSKGLKGSLLDGVLTGVGTTGSQQQQQSSSKKGFGFNLASKLVPNVGGLLAGASGNKNQTKPNTLNTAVSMPSVTVTGANNDSLYKGMRSFGDETLSQTNDDYFKEISSSHENHNDYCDVDYNNQNLQGYNFGMENTNNTGTSDYDEYGVGNYSEFENYNMANVYAVETGLTINTEPTITHQHGIAVTKAEMQKSPTDSSQVSKMANVPATRDQSIHQKSESTEVKASGMFGSFLGKAAAAVQSATQVVNQSAAAIVQQKTPVTTAVREPMITESTTSASTALNNAYNSHLQQQIQNDSLLGHQTYSSNTTAAGTDYENSNLVAVYNHEIPITGMSTNNYYSNGNQSQPPTVTTAKMLPTVPAVGKKLPNITNGSKSGIGYLIKQQPTEIYDDDIEGEYEESRSPQYLNDNSELDDFYQDVDKIKSLAPNSAHLNGYYEQHHSFNDPVNSGGYDYREDYFDEEDEYKYLEREAEAEQEKLYRQQQKQQKLLNQHQKQSSSLEYIEESHIEADDDVAHDDFFNEDNYPSEDSGNYLDESSSGSVGGLMIKPQRESTNGAQAESSITGPPTPATRSLVLTTQSTVSSHQQIKKQDSIIMEEDEDKILCGPTNNLIESPVQNIEKVCANNNAQVTFRRKSSDITIDDDLSVDADSNDRLGDLTQPPQRNKKVLIRGETEEVVSGHMHIKKRQKPPEVTSKQRWHWAYNKIIMQLNCWFKRNQ